MKHRVVKIGSGWHCHGAKGSGKSFIKAWCYEAYYDWRLRYIEVVNLFFPYRWCRASLVMWASGYEWYWSKPDKCGFCFTCMTDEERDAFLGGKNALPET